VSTTPPAVVPPRVAFWAPVWLDGMGVTLWGDRAVMRTRKINRQTRGSTKEEEDDGEHTAPGAHDDRRSVVFLVTAERRMTILTFRGAPRAAHTHRRCLIDTRIKLRACGWSIGNRLSIDCLFNY